MVVSLVYKIYNLLYDFAEKAMDFLNGMYTYPETGLTVPEWAYRVERIMPGFLNTWEILWGGVPPTLLELLIGGGVTVILVISVWNFLNDLWT